MELILYLSLFFNIILLLPYLYLGYLAYYLSKKGYFKGIKPILSAAIKKINRKGTSNLPLDIQDSITDDVIDKSKFLEFLESENKDTNGTT